MSQLWPDTQLGQLQLGSTEDDGSILVLGAAGGVLHVTGGSGGNVGAPFVGIDGGLIAITGGAGGSVFIAITGTTGGSIEVAPGSGGSLYIGVTGHAGGLLTISGGSTGVVIANSERPWTVFVNGVDRTKYIAANSISGRADLNSRASAQFVVKPEMSGGAITSTWRPGYFDPVVIIYTRGGVWRMFGGFVESTEEEIKPGCGGYYEIAVTCTDYGAITDRRYVARWYDTFHGSVAGVVGYDIVQSFLNGTGITYGWGGIDAETASVGSDNLVNYLTASEAFNLFADKANLAWRIDYYGTFRWMLKDTGYDAAPFSIADADGNWRTMKVRESKFDFWNSAIVRNSQGLTALQTDEYVASGALAVPTEYPLEVKPVILVDGVEVDDSLVAEESERGSTPGWEWYYFSGGIGVFPASPATGTIQVIYPSRLSYVARAPEGTAVGTLRTDALASIATLGRWEHLEEAKDITDPDDLQEYADAVLAAGMTPPTILDIETDRAGLEPGQLLTVNVSNAEGDFLVESVSWAEIPDSHFYVRYQVQASNAPQRRNGAAFFQRLISQSRQAVDRIDSHISFVLADSSDGAAVGGLTTGLKNAFRTARKSGYLKMARLSFGSIARGTLTTSDIEIDVLKNGVSIFTSGVLKLKAGSTEPTVRFRFADPKVNEGDEFQVNVIAADSSATDGWLDIQVAG